MRPFSQVDVFSSEFMLGNAVAVVHDADGLTDEEMTAFARWTQLSETTFVMRATDPGADYRLRIFTTSRELPFAGHPTLGSARAWLASKAGHEPKSPGCVVQECGAGLVRIRHDGERLAFVAPPLLRSGPVDSSKVEHISAGLGLRSGQVVDARWVDNGPGWIALLLDDARSVNSIERGPAAMGLTDSIGVVGPYPPGHEIGFEVRAFVPDAGLGEDPVTGSLNAAIAQWLIPAGIAPAAYTVAQGARVGRKGRVYVDSVDGEVWVGGDTVIGISGTVVI